MKRTIVIVTAAFFETSLCKRTPPGAQYDLHSVTSIVTIPRPSVSEGQGTGKLG